jgi:predicted short-subunit dehydrogenase-like oxidoreductase (DUF2520 family)
MKAWGRSEGRGGGQPGRPDARAIEELEERGIDLDPERPPTHRHGEVQHASDHAHPHVHAEPGEPPVTGIVGAGAVGTALGVALSRAGWPVAAVASRDEARREHFRSLVPGARGFAEATALLDEVELIILAVPDDALAALAAELRMYGGQAMVHTSGALGAEVLEPARAAGAQVGGFHPLVAFADTDRAVTALHGATVAIEGDDQLASLLAEMAEAVGATAVRLAPGSKPAYHAAAMLSAGGFVALLDVIAELGGVAGLDEAGSLAIYGGLVEQTLGNARALGVARALTGPMVRGDVGTIQGHLDALGRHAPDALPLYRAIAEREVAIAEARGALAPAVGEIIRKMVARPD